MLVLPIHLTLLDKSKSGLESTPRAHVLETVQDLLILTVLLMSKLVAREAKNHQTPGEAALQLIELGEVPGGRASKGGHILNQHCPATERVEIYLLPVQADGIEVVEGLGNVSHGEEQSECSSGVNTLQGLWKAWGGRRSLPRTERNHTMGL